MRANCGKDPPKTSRFTYCASFSQQHIVEILLRNPKHSKMLYRPNKAGETPYNIDIAHKRAILGDIFGAREYRPIAPDWFDPLTDWSEAWKDTVWSLSFGTRPISNR